MSQQTADRVTVYADYICPFCYLGYESFDRYRSSREEPLAADWRPFDLRAGRRRADGSIDESVDSGKDESYYEEAERNVRRLADRYDVDMAQTLAKDVDSFDAQRVAWRARESHPEAFERFHRGVFDALWEDGDDIGDPDVLADIAAEAGLPDGFVAETLADDDSADALREAFERSQRRGITGVPAFVAGDHVARGAVPPEQLERLVEGA